MRKLAAAVIGAIMLMAVPALAAPVSEKFVTIGGPDRLKPKAELKIPIRCSVACETTARTKLKIPDSSIPADVAKSNLAAGQPERLIVELNETASKAIEDQPNASRLRVTVRAESNGGERVKVEKNFKFRAP